MRLFAQLYRALETHNPAYTIPVVDRMDLYQCGVALGLDLEREHAEQADAVQTAAQANPDGPVPAKYAHLVARMEHEKVARRVAHERFGVVTPRSTPVDSLLTDEQRAVVHAEAEKVAPAPVPRAYGEDEMIGTVGQSLPGGKLMPRGDVNEGMQPSQI